MELEVGMYVRTKFGRIGKVICFENAFDVTNINDVKKNKTIVLDTHYNFEDEYDYLYDFEDILKASHNIIDLIECLDIVELYIVGLEEDNITQIIRPETLNELKELKKHIKNGAKIKSITTREMFESMSYKVGEVWN